MEYSGDLRVVKEHDLWLAIYAGYGFQKTLFADCVQEKDAERLVKCWNEHDDLVNVCKAILLWAKTPGDHGGNPYCIDFVKQAQKALIKAQS